MEPNPNGKEHFIRSSHLNIEELKNASYLQNDYLKKTKTSEYPKPKFYVFHLKHDTGPKALHKIKDRGFEDPKSGSEDPDKLPLVWWSLAVQRREIQLAETRLLEEDCPNQTQRQPSFLEKFTSSPAFSKKSRYGSYRFTFTVKEVLEAYSKQVRTNSINVFFQ